LRRNKRVLSTRKALATGASREAMGDDTNGRPISCRRPNNSNLQRKMISRHICSLESRGKLFLQRIRHVKLHRNFFQNFFFRFKNDTWTVFSSLGIHIIHKYFFQKFCKMCTTRLSRASKFHECYPCRDCASG
jgi:hypothetical protein